MLTNKIKKGAKVKYNHPIFGHRTDAEMADNARGIRRMIKTMTPHGTPEIGSTYIDTITHVFVDGEWRPVEISVAHQKQLRKIRSWF